MKKLLVLDLYHTLIYVGRIPLEKEADAVVGGAYIYIRPGFDTFFRQARKRFDIGIWTNDPRERATNLVEGILDPTQLAFLWTSENCDVQPAKYIGMQVVKNLEKLTNFGYIKKDIIMIDDSPENIVAGESTVMVIKPYSGEEEDRELERVWKEIS